MPVSRGHCICGCDGHKATVDCRQGKAEQVVSSVTVAGGHSEEDAGKSSWNPVVYQFEMPSRQNDRLTVLCLGY